jgi:nucleotide-binding universal stress UspA family protein
MDETELAGCIVVGVDGSSGSMQAVDWGAEQAAVEDRPLALLHSVGLLDTSATYWLDRAGVDHGRLLAEIALAGHTILDDAAEHAMRSHPGLEVRRVLRHVDPRQALLSAAGHARLTVVGSRGRGPVGSLLLGSVSVSVSKHAPGPVVVVRPRVVGHGGGGVVVSTDGTEQSQPAVELAFEVADFRHEPLTVVHCFWDAVKVSEGAWDVPDDEPGLEVERARLAEAVAGMRELHPDVKVHLQLARGFEDQRLIRASSDADLIVVGTKEIGLLADLVYGSLASAVVEHAHCAVAVVPFAPADDKDTGRA